MAEFQEEVYIIEKQEITDDEAESNESPELDLENDPDLNDLGDLDDESDDDLNDFNQLKNKVDEKLAKKTFRAIEDFIEFKNQCDDLVIRVF